MGFYKNNQQMIFLVKQYSVEIILIILYIFLSSHNHRADHMDVEIPEYVAIPDTISASDRNCNSDPKLSIFIFSSLHTKNLKDLGVRFKHSIKYFIIYKFYFRFIP